MKSWLNRVLRRFAPLPITDEEITQIRQRSDQGVAEARARDEEVRDISRRLKRQREQNNFGPLVWAALRGETDV
ncbi:DUF7620 family protein [Nocardiopsis synnemataformans]|uniref:DUF7620 family protein n=1 Tax=Nocardiopsis synnemataformans TaxID=61305 RepID=UPI003EBBE247